MTRRILATTLTLITAWLIAVLAWAILAAAEIIIRFRLHH